MKTYRIYKILIDGNVKYIGCTSQQLKKRYYQHCNDSNSQVYKNTFAHNISSTIDIQEINIKYKNNNVYTNLPYVIAYKYEEILTYIFGMDNELFNENAGNVFYDNRNDMELYTHIHMFLYDLQNKIIDIDFSDLSEILTIINKKLGMNISNNDIKTAIHSISSQKLNQILTQFDDCISNLICEDDYF